MDWSIIVIIVQLIFLEMILSIDNAAVMGAMVSHLSDHKPITWPKGLSRFQKVLDKLMGNQRTAALRVGLFGAYFGRGLMLLLASVIIRNPWLKVIGSLYLIRLAMDDLGAPGHEGSEEASMQSLKKQGFWMTVLNLNLMDMAFSLDNVVAAVSLSSNILVVILGVGIGILVIRYAAGIFSYIVEKEPVLKDAAYVLVLNIGIEILLEEFAHIAISDWTRFSISIATILLALAYSKLKFMRFFRPLLIWLGQGLSVVNMLIAWALAPLLGVVKFISKGFKQPV